MSAIGVGDWVRCVDPTIDGSEPYEGSLRFGGVYQVRALMPASRCRFCGDRGPGLSIDGEGPDDEEDSWCICQIVPIWRGDKTLIETLLEPLADGVEPVGSDLETANG